MRPPGPCLNCLRRSAECHTICEQYRIFKYVQENYRRDLKKAKQTERDLSGIRKHRTSSIKREAQRAGKAKAWTEK